MRYEVHLLGTDTVRGPYTHAGALRLYVQLNRRSDHEVWCVRAIDPSTKADRIRRAFDGGARPRAIASDQRVTLSYVLRVLRRNARKGRPPSKRPGPITVQLPADLDAAMRNTPGHSPAQAVICAVYKVQGRACPICRAFGGAAGGGSKGLPPEIRAAITAARDLDDPTT